MAVPMQIYVHSRRGCDIEKLKDEFARGLTSDPSPYGFDEAESENVHLMYSRDRPHSRISLFLFQKLNLDLLQALNNLKAIRKADAIWTVLEWEWMAVALLQRIKLAPRRPIIANSVWFAELWTMHAPVKRLLYKWLMMPHVVLTLHSERARQHLENHIPDRSFIVSPFGISNKAWKVTTPSPGDWTGRAIKIYSIGNDRSRDWETLLAAFGNDSRFELTIVCKWLAPELDARYANVRTPQALTIKEQNDLYLQADVVVVSMSENTYSGITVALEAVCLGIPVVSSRTGGVDTYFTDDEVVFVPPRDPAALRQAVLLRDARTFLEYAQRAQHRFIQSGYTAREMAGRYLQMTRKIIGH